MKYAIRFSDGFYLGLDDEKVEAREALKWDVRATVYGYLIASCFEDAFNRREVRIVRLRPKSKPATIPVPTVALDDEGVNVNGSVVYCGSMSSAVTQNIFGRLRRALGLPVTP